MKVIKKEINININILDDDKLFETIINLLAQQDHTNMSYTISEDEVYDDKFTHCRLCKTVLPGWWTECKGELCINCDMKDKGYIK